MRESNGAKRRILASRSRLLLSDLFELEFGCEFERHLLLPASAQSPVKLHETLVLGAARLREREFSGKERALTVQHFEISGGASLVAHGGQVDRLLQVRYGILLANPDLMEFLVPDQRIGHG